MCACVCEVMLMVVAAAVRVLGTASTRALHMLVKKGLTSYIIDDACV